MTSPEETRQSRKAGKRAAENPHFLGHRSRLRERFQRGSESLPDYEILELLLCQAIPRGDVKPLAKELIRRFGSLGGVLTADPDRLMECKGVGESAAVALRVVHEAAMRLARGEVLGRPVISSWQALLDYCQTAMGYEKTEQFRVLFLDRKNVLIADEVLQTGTVDHTPVYPREVIKRALELQASAVILVHNHPSGDPTPSRGDIDMTREIQESGRRLGVILHDHVVVGRGRTASFKTLGLL